MDAGPRARLPAPWRAGRRRAPGSPGSAAPRPRRGGPPCRCARGPRGSARDVDNPGASASRARACWTDCSATLYFSRALWSAASFWSSSSRVAVWESTRFLTRSWSFCASTSSAYDGAERGGLGPQAGDPRPHLLLLPLDGPPRLLERGQPTTGPGPELAPSWARAVASDFTIRSTFNFACRKSDRIWSTAISNGRRSRRTRSAPRST